jgi:hypothetical protein
MKVCSKCGIEKTLDSFYNKMNQCISCRKKSKKKYRETNKIKIRDYRKQYKESNKEKIAEKDKIYRQNNKEKRAEYAKQYCKENKEKITEYRKKWYKANKEKISLDRKQYYLSNKEEISKKHLKYIYKKKATDPVFKFKEDTKILIRMSFNRCNHRKKSKTVDILGCSLDFFKEYIQSKFKKGMTLENHGQWEFDHIIPLATAKTLDDVIKLNHYTNLQPLWRYENRSKSDKIIEQQLKLI